MEALAVRRAGPDDAGAMAAVIEAVAPEGTLGAEPPVDVDARAHGYRELVAREDAAAWVLLERSDVVGLLTLAPRTRGVLGLATAIVAGARGRGGGRALVDAALAWAADTDAHKVDLEVWPDNGRAIGLYAAAGFVVEGLRDRHYRRADGTLRSSLLMARRLD
ncbi:GNAT family N-acetyltransferase [Actinomycetospora sp. OC33-EN08]|uniref:GNAT family N-acetyltransferase n=1 Tax=Actinomycetospora aurantiaca TaxID=3129233 RepID=A0ABU8MR49_9PSEU